MADSSGWPQSPERGRALALYAVIVMVAFHLRVVLAEEPWLDRTFGEEWQRYTRQVRRWC